MINNKKIYYKLLIYVIIYTEHNINILQQTL